MLKNYMFLAIVLALVFSLFSCGPSPEVTPTSPSEEGEARELDIETQTIAVLVDENTYHQVTSEIERYVKDIEDDLKANVLLYHQNWQNPEEVRNRLLSLKDKNLRGAVLIGEIPAAYFETTTWCRLRPGFVSDRYYMDLESDDLFTDEDEDGKFELDDYYGGEDKLGEIIWVGRIKPPVGGTKGIDLIKDYFDRNHQYRTGKTSPTKTLLVYSPNIPELPPPMIQEGDRMVEGTPRVLTLEKYLENIRDDLTLHGSSNILYSSSEIDILVGSLRDEYLEALQKEYEILSFEAHGTPTSQSFKDGPITFEDIETICPKPYFYFLNSCSNGDFSRENYIGGHYLFDGNGLLVYTLAAPSIFSRVGNMRIHIQPLALGQTFGETFVLNFHWGGIGTLGLPEVILGDPTLSIRPKMGIPRVEVDSTEIDFGEIKIDFGKLLEDIENMPVPPPGDPLKNFVEEEVVGKEMVRIKNTGTGKAIFRIWSFYLANEKGTRAEESSISWTEEVVSPGESQIFQLTFVPPETGSYTGFIVINTNDPNKPVVVIKLRGRGI